MTASFTRNVRCDFFYDFQTPCGCCNSIKETLLLRFMHLILLFPCTSDIFPRKDTLFENYLRCLILSILTFSTNFWPIWPDWKHCLTARFRVSKLDKLAIFGIFNEVLSIVNVARFARNVEWDFSEIFKHCEKAVNVILMFQLQLHFPFFSIFSNTSQCLKI